MNLKTIALAAVSISMLAIHSSGASAQATRFYNSPAEARTDNASEARAARTERAVNRARGVHAYGSSQQDVWHGQQGVWYGQPNAFDKHTSEVKDW